MARKIKRLRFIHLLLLLPFALLIDAISIPVAVIGSATVLLLWIIFWIVGIRTKWLTGGMFISFIIELLPGLSALPGVTGYLLSIYFIGRFEEAAGESAGESKESSVEKEKREIMGKRKSAAQRRAKAIAKIRAKREGVSRER